MRGRVKWFNDAKGYGFITPDDGSPDAFVHWSAVIGSGHRTLLAEEPVDFDVEQSPKGTQAINVQRLNPA